MAQRCSAGMNVIRFLILTGTIQEDNRLSRRYAARRADAPVGIGGFVLFLTKHCIRHLGSASPWHNGNLFPAEQRMDGPPLKREENVS